MRYGCCAQYQSMRSHRLYPRAIRKSCNFQEPKRRKTEPDEPGLGRAELRDEGAIVALPNDKQGWLWKTQIQEEDTVFIFTQPETARKYLTVEVGFLSSRVFRTASGCVSSAHCRDWRALGDQYNTEHMSEAGQGPPYKTL